MTNDELTQKVLTGVRELYKQNQQILKEIDAIKKSVGTIEPTHNDPPLPTDAKPWDKWKKPEQTTNNDTVKL